ncbi:MAG: universal stress protein UspA, partial [Alphaproteobacteria bacterium]|nr:universal stress protein UspA [Alphaproteobacteria bacterium]
YQSHLDIAAGIAKDEDAHLTCKLLDGKPYQAISKYLDVVGASLLLIGKTGIHADADLDIGGNAENLLRLAPCHIWLGQSTYTPPADAVARETIAWTPEAERSLERVPEGPRQMVRMAIIRFAQESGHTMITSGLMEEATQRFCPERGGGMAADETLEWSAEAMRLLDGVADTSLAATVRLRAEKRARRDDAVVVSEEHVRPFLEDDGVLSMTWTATALARLARVPEMVRGSVKRRIEVNARDAGLGEVTLEAVEDGLAESRCVMESTMGAGGHRLGMDEDG